MGSFLGRRGILVERNVNLAEYGFESTLYGRRYIGDWSDYAFDGYTLPSIEDSEAQCEIGIEMTAGHVGAVSELRFFMNYFDTDLLIGELTFQGSNDGFATEAVDLMTASCELKEGWNTYDLSDTAPTYSSYRLYNELENGCDDIGEVQIYGHEVIENESDTHECSVEVVLKDGEEAPVYITVGQPETMITYNVESTPVINSVSNRFPSVEGGDEITFRGTDLSIDPADYEIFISGVPCTVTVASAE